MKQVRIADPAERDLDDIWRYIAEKSGSVDVAKAFVNSLTETFSLFSRTPEAGTTRDEIESGLRGFPVANYIVYYRDIGEYLLISRVIHGMRDQSAAFADE